MELPLNMEDLLYIDIISKGHIICNMNLVKDRFSSCRKQGLVAASAHDPAIDRG